MLSILLLVIVCLANLLLAGVVYLSNAKNALNRVFASLCFILPVWSVVVFLEDYIRAPGVIDLLVFFDFAIAAAMVGLFFWFCKILTGYSFRYVSWLIIGLFVVTELMIILGKTVTVSIDNGLVVFHHGLGYVVFIGFMVTSVLIGILSLIRSYRGLTGRHKAQMQLINTGLSLTIIGLIAADIAAPSLGLNDVAITRLGIYGLLFFTGFSTYAVVRHRFLDVRKLVARSITYILLLITMAGGYAGALVGASQLFFSNNHSSWGQNAVTTVLAIILALTFQPLRRFFERVTDNIFYRNRYDSQVVLNQFSGILVSELDLDRILKRSITDICEQLQIQFGQVVVFNHDRLYRIEHHGPLPKRLMVVPELQRLNRAVIIADELAGGDRKELLDDHGIRVSLMLHTRDEFIGYLLLGDKLSGDIYSTQDIELLEIIVKELAVAIMNAKAYAEIQEFNQTLQARVDHATSRLRVANRHLKELDKAKDEFISMASHQLRTPLTTIKGYLSMILEGDAGRITGTQKEYVDYAFGASERMVNLISDLLNVSRLSAGRFLIQKTPTDVTAMVRDEVRQLKSHADAKGIGLDFEAPNRELPMVELDDNKTRQVIMNFIDNAIYYTKEGKVTVTLDQEADLVRLRVTDSGIGVPDEAKKKLFSKFYRADNAQSVRPDGTGLGLYLAKRVVEDQGGTIIFSSTIGKGSTFGFELPFATHATKKVAHAK